MPISVCFYAVAARLVERKSLVFKGNTMRISLPRPSADIHTSQQVTTEPLQHRSTPTVKVSNVAATVSEDMLRMYFENAKRSRGGDIENLRLVRDKKKAFISFKDPSGECPVTCRLSGGFWSCHITASNKPFT